MYNPVSISISGKSSLVEVPAFTALAKTALSALKDLQEDSLWGVPTMRMAGLQAKYLAQIVEYFESGKHQGDVPYPAYLICWVLATTTIKKELVSSSSDYITLILKQYENFLRGMSCSKHIEALPDHVLVEPLRNIIAKRTAAEEELLRELIADSYVTISCGASLIMTGYATVFLGT